jgi:hypothetical protein
VHNIGSFHKSEKAPDQKLHQTETLPEFLHDERILRSTDELLPAIYIPQAQDSTKNHLQSSQTTDRIRSLTSIQKEADIRKVRKYQINSHCLPPMGVSFDNDKEQPDEEDTDFRKPLNTADLLI